jgi:hypothetical protein
LLKIWYGATAALHKSWATCAWAMSKYEIIRVHLCCFYTSTQECFIHQLQLLKIINGK